MQLLLGVMGRHIATMGRHSVVRSGSGPCGAFHRVASALWPIARARRYMSADIGSAGGIARDGGSCYAASDAARRLTAWATSRTGSDEEFVDATSEAGCEVSSMKVVISVTESNEAELLSELLLDYEASVLITEHQPDGVERPIFDAHDSGRSLWDTCAVEAYFPPESDVRAALLAASEALGRPLEYAAEAVLTQDWVDAIRAEYRPVEACDGVWVVPAGLQAPDPAASPPNSALSITLEPGVAFGTGEHPTTRLCLAHLQTLASEGALSGARLMDYGAGSGVLAIAALLMGAGAADGTDTDILAVRVAGRNAALNGVAERGRFVQCGPSSTDDAPFSGEMYDVVVANILKGPLMDLRDRLATYASPGARLALSGIVVSQAEEIVEHYSSLFEDLSFETMGDWAIVHGRRKQH